MADYNGSSDYPAALDNFEVERDTEEGAGQDLADVRAGVNALQSTLGLDPQGDSADVAERLASLDRTVYVSRFGAALDGVTDDAQALEDAAAAMAPGRTLHLGEGDLFTTAWPADLLDMPDISIVGGSAEGARVLIGAWSGVQPFVKMQGAKAAAIALTVDAALGATTLTLASTSSLAAGDELILGSNVPFANDALRYKGERVRIKSVDSATVVTIRGFLRDSYAVANSASVEKVSSLRGVTLRDFALVNTAPNTNTAQALQLELCRDFHIERVHTEGIDGAGIVLKNCADGTVHAPRFRDHTDNSGAGRYGYGLLLSCATEQVVVSDPVARRVRHAVTTDGVDNERGVVRDCTIANGRARECTSGAWDTHYNCENILFTACAAADGSYFGFQLRGKRVKVQGGSVDRCQAGVTIFDAADGGIIKGLDIRDLPEAGSEGHGIKVGLAHDIDISDFTIDRIGRRGITIGAAAKRLKIRNGRISNTGMGNVSGYRDGVVTDGSLTNGNSGLMVDNCVFVREAAVAPNMQYGIKQQSAAWGGGLFANNIFQSMGFGTISDSGSATPANATANNTTAPVLA